MLKTQQFHVAEVRKALVDDLVGQVCGLVPFLGEENFSPDCFVTSVVLTEHVHDEDKLQHFYVRVAKYAVM